MGIYAGIPRRPDDILALFVRAVLLCLGILVLLSETKVNDMNHVSLGTQTQKKVVGLNVAVQVGT